MAPLRRRPRTVKKKLASHLVGLVQDASGQPAVEHAVPDAITTNTTTNDNNNNNNNNDDDARRLPTSPAMAKSLSPRLQRSPITRDHGMLSLNVHVGPGQTGRKLRPEEISQLRQELANRREAIRKKYKYAAEALRARFELRIHRIPAHVRKMKVSELRSINGTSHNLIL
ncbi:hypothetical protein V1514DRAFT_331208 [Lipomyces japonicus]|uniref:uncharacterized protein n=1 Tax=Lipomyces japonicus TaxID=56871 RepID=UPI0034CD28C9